MRGPNKSTRRPKHHMPVRSRQRRATQLSGRLPTCSVRHHVLPFNLCVIRGGVVTGGGTVGGHTSGRERAAQPKYKYIPWLSVAWAIMLFTLVSPSASSHAVRTSCCFRKLICMSDSIAFPCSFWICHALFNNIYVFFFFM